LVELLLAMSLFLSPVSVQHSHRLCETWYSTGYTPTGNPTASGDPLSVGYTVAADYGIPLYTEIWIEGYGDRVVQDRGDGLKPWKAGYVHWVDIAVWTKTQAYQVTGPRLVCR
jgi:3D (Asp-Asp-Asp) domain-containing protein